MLTKKGKIREHHFCHRQVVECNGETYTHKCAKQFIKNLFDRQDHFYISFTRTIECCLKETCEYQASDLAINNGKCSQEKDVRYDLKEYYDTCELEAQYNGFVADILLKNSQKPEIKPCFIEIAVTHPCEEAKINSRIPIIEISIPAGTDNFDELKTISETAELPFGKKTKKGIEVTFRNFKKSGISKVPHNIYDVLAFFINGNGKAQVRRYKNSCPSYGRRHLEHGSDYEVHFSNEYVAYNGGVAIANLENKRVPNCWVCQHHGYSFTWGKHYCNKGVCYQPTPAQAASCSEYSFARWQALKWEKQARAMGYKIVKMSDNKKP